MIETRPSQNKFYNEHSNGSTHLNTLRITEKAGRWQVQSASKSSSLPTMFSGDHLDQEPGTGYGETITQGMTKFCFFGSM